jgi:PKD repeat protein
VVQFDGSITPSTLIVPKANYAWNFGDGTSAIGPSVEHTFGKGGNFTVKLTVTDRGGNVASVSQTMTILGSNGQPIPVTPPPSNKNISSLQARLLLLPQSLRTLLRTGLHLRVLSNEPADGFVTLSISRGAAKRAHIKTGRGSTVVVGRGTVSGITTGTVNLHVKLSRGMAKQLGHLRHVNLTVRLALAAAGGAHVAVDAAGRY